MAGSNREDARAASQIFADQTGQPIDRIAKDANRNFWMTPTEAEDHGLVGSIIHSTTSCNPAGPTVSRVRRA